MPQRKILCHVSKWSALLVLLLLLNVSIPDTVFATESTRILIAAIPANFPPYHFLDIKTGQPTGFAIDVMDEIAKISGLEIRYDVYDTWPQAIQALKEKRADIFPNVGITSLREEFLDFTRPYETFHIHIFVRSSTTTIHSLEDLSDITVGIVSENRAEELMDQFGKAKLVRHESIEKALLSLLSGGVDALVYPEQTLTIIARQSGLENRIKVVGKPLLEIKRAIGTRKGLPEDLKKLDDAVRAFIPTNRYQEIYTRWHGTPPPFWNAARLLATMGILLAVIVSALLFWRYRSLVTLNRDLYHSIELLKKRDLELKESEGRYAMALRAAEMGSWDWNILTGEMNWSDQVEPMFGFSKGEFNGTFDEFIARVHIDDRQNLQDRINDCIERDQDYSIEHRVIWPDGTERWLMEVGNVIRDRSGRAVQMLGVVTDITRRRKTENALRAITEGTSSELGQQFFHLLVQNLAEVLHVQYAFVASLQDDNSAQTLSVWNGGSHGENFPYTLKGTPCANVAVQGVCYYKSEVQKAFPDDLILVDMGVESYLGTPLIDRDGTAIGILVVLDTKPMQEDFLARDLLHVFASRAAAELGRIQAEEELRLTKFAMDHSSDSVFWVDHDGRFVTVNDSATKHLGYSRQELLTKMVWDIDPNFTASAWPKHWETLKRKESSSFESIHRTVEGHDIPVEIVVNYVNFAGREYHCAFVRDIRDRKALEDQLRQAQKMEAIGTLAGGIAHDFNNILAAVFGYTELALMERDNPQKLESNLNQIHQAAIRARELVKQILTFSRRTDVEKHPLRVSLVVKEAMKLLRSTISTTIDIEQNISSERTVLADPTQIHQIIMNLCTNAYQAMREKEGILKVTLDDVDIHGGDLRFPPTLKPGTYQHLEVVDSGHGMNSATLEKIFEPYFTTKKAGEGTGLGLSVVHGIIHNHNGHIAAHSEPGKGSTFHVYLPVIAEDLQKSLPASAPLPPLGHNEKILFVDDEQSLVSLAEVVLLRQGYRVTTFNDSEKALYEFTENATSYDLLITDMNMPHMNGLKLIHMAREIRPDLPVILCTGHSDLLDKQMAKAMNIDYFFHKPVTADDLAMAVRKALDRNQNS